MKDRDQLESSCSSATEMISWYQERFESNEILAIFQRTDTFGR